MTDADALQGLAATAANALAPVYELLGRIATEVLSGRGGDAELTDAQLSGLAPLCADLLTAEPLAWGVGFVAAPAVVEGRDRYLAWWQRSGTRITRLRLNFDPTSVDVYDYLQMDWYQLARRGQARVAAGPYVDYSGSNVYTITATVPVLAGGAFLGVAGADLVVGEVERRLLGVLREADGDAVIVSPDRRVIVANTPRWLVGSRMPVMPTSGDDGFRAVAALPNSTGWVLALA